MAIIRFRERPFFRNPWAEFERMRREMDMLTRDVIQQERATVYPALNIQENDTAILVMAEIAGVSAEDLDVSVEGDTLTIKGERKAPPLDEQTSFHRREIEYGRFRRALSLPCKVEPNAITAKTVDGILTITLPKAASAQPKQIKVEVG